MANEVSTAHAGMPSGRRFPLWVKLAYTAWAIVLIPFWVRYQGWNNFLWLSDIAFLATCAALWTESRFLASVMAVGIVLPDIGWSLYFLARLLIDAGPFERSGFMFNQELPLLVRGLSLFHLVVPPLLVWTVYRLGYDRRALPAQTLLSWAVLLVVYFLTNPAESINFVFGFGDPPRAPLPQPFWLVLEMILLPIGVYWPTHLLLAQWVGSDRRRRN